MLDQLDEHPPSTQLHARTALVSTRLAPSSRLDQLMVMLARQMLVGLVQPGARHQVNARQAGPARSLALGGCSPSWSSPELGTGWMLTKLVQPGAWHCARGWTSPVSIRPVWLAPAVLTRVPISVSWCHLLTAVASCLQTL